MASVLICCISFLHVASAALELHQIATLTKTATKIAFIECGAPDLRTGYLHWYSQKEQEPLKRVLYMATGGERTEEMKQKNSILIHEPGFEHVTAEQTGSDIYVLKISGLTASDSATYYCAYMHPHNADHDAHPATRTTCTST